MDGSVLRGSQCWWLSRLASARRELQPSCREIGTPRAIWSAQQQVSAQCVRSSVRAHERTKCALPSAHVPNIFALHKSSDVRVVALIEKQGLGALSVYDVSQLLRSRSEGVPFVGAFKKYRVRGHRGAVCKGCKYE